MDSCEGDKRNSENKSEDGNHLSDDRDVPEPFWLRYFNQDGNGYNRFLLDYNAYFLPFSGVILWTVFLFL